MKPSLIVNFIVDESGSMASCREQAVKGFNEYIQGLRDKGDVSVSLTKFNERAQVVYTALPAQEAPDLNEQNYTPMGGTALLDAIGVTLRILDERLKEYSHAYSVLVVIATDGCENSSHLFTHESIKSMVEERRAKGNWTFAYVGASIDAWDVAQSIGMSRGSCHAMAVGTPEGTRAMYDDLTTATEGFYREVKTSGGVYSDTSFWKKKPPEVPPTTTA